MVTVDPTWSIPPRPNTAVLRWRPLREGDGEGPPAPWCSESYHHDSIHGSCVGGVWDALSELARGGGRWLATVEATVYECQCERRDFIVRNGRVEPLGTTGAQFVVRPWETVDEPWRLFAFLLTLSEKLTTRAAIACLLAPARRGLPPAVYDDVALQLRTVWDWTFTAPPGRFTKTDTPAVARARRVLYNLVDNRPKFAREFPRAGDPTQEEFDIVYEAAHAADVENRWAYMHDENALHGSQRAPGEQPDMDDMGTFTERLACIREAIRDDVFELLVVEEV